MNACILILVLLSVVKISDAFTKLKTFSLIQVPIDIKQPDRRGLHSLRMSGQNIELYGDELENREYLKTLLTFQAIKTFMYYCEEFRDEVTSKWIADFDEKMKAKEEAEGKISWEQYMETLMRTEPEEILIQKIQQRARGGAGANRSYMESLGSYPEQARAKEDEERKPNPYLNNEAVYEFTVLIDPFSLAKRILSVREQLSQEWTEDLSLISLANQELLRYHFDKTIMGEVEAKKGTTLVFESDAFGANTPYRTESYKILTEMTTTIAMRRCEKDIIESGNSKAQRWFNLIKSQTSNLEGEELLRFILDGKTGEEADETPDQKLERALSAERMAKVLMAQRENAAEENMIYLEDTRNDHNQMLTRFLNDRLQDEMSVVDLLNYEYQKTPSAEESQEESLEKLEDAEET
mmetsp:Transcript_16776/g.22166  ORF Transcript_16776/g.22166 Transcript_16776/m.22166 type:complete len:409 (+) Transcript_16776:180-1406(+)